MRPLANEKRLLFCVLSYIMFFMDNQTTEETELLPIRYSVYHTV